MNESEQKTALLAPCIPLKFLVSPKPRRKPAGMEGFSDSAYFHRLHDLFWTFREPSAVAILRDDDREALADFERVFASLPWREFDTEMQFSDLPDDDLTVLIEPGRKLLQFLEARTAKSAAGWSGLEGC
jgi:hypothetical protein